MTSTANLTSLALILWAGMLIIAGSIWVLSSQVRNLADILEARAREPISRPRTPARPKGSVARAVPLPGTPVRASGERR